MSDALIHDPELCRLGKRPAKRPHKMLHDLIDFEKLASVQTVPANIVNSADGSGAAAMTVALAMYLNNTEGDCTIAGMANTIRANSDDAVEPTDAEVQAAYIAITAQENDGNGYNPETGANDNGCVELDVLDYFTKTPIGGEKLLGHAGVDMTNWAEIKQTLYLAGSIYPGWELSTDQQTQQIWEPGKAAAGSWGGHCMPWFDYYTEIPAGLTVGGAAIPQSLGTIGVGGTWGGYKPFTSSWLAFACDEGHALITPSWLTKAQALGVVDQAQLDAYLATLAPEK